MTTEEYNKLIELEHLILEVYPKPNTLVDELNSAAAQDSKFGVYSPPKTKEAACRKYVWFSRGVHKLWI